MDDSSATATPEPGTKKPGKQILNPPSSKAEQDDGMVSNQIEMEREEKGKTKKTGKIAIEEVDFVPAAETKVRAWRSYRGINYLI